MHSEPIIECILNLSEGRNQDFLLQLYNKLSSVKGCELAHYDQGFDVNRTVLTIVGTIEAVLTALELVIEAVQSNLDISSHHGIHPRVGIIDVIPFVPLKGIDRARLQPIIDKWSGSISDKFSLPIIYYGEMATQPNTTTLAQIRKGGFANLTSRINNGDVHLDHGTPDIINSLGISCITVRNIMVAFNINLNTKDFNVAKNIARGLRDERKRHSKLKNVRFLAWWLPSYEYPQISTNIYDTTDISMVQLYDIVQKIAMNYLIQVCGSELIGLTTGYALAHNNMSHIEASDILKLNKSSDFNLSLRLLDKYISD